MWNWNLFENSAVIAEGRRRSICAFIMAILIGSIILALTSVFPPNTSGFYGVLVGGVILCFMGLAGFVIMCVYYPMNCCRRTTTSFRGVGLQQGTANSNTSPLPETEKPSSPAPEYVAPPSYEKAVSDHANV